MKRRDFNKMALFTAASLVVGKPGASACANEGRPGEIERYFIYERSAGRYGLLPPPFAKCSNVVVIAGDVTRVWYEELHYLWQQEGVATAGLTRESEFFVLRTLARDYGYRVTYQEPCIPSRLVLWELIPEKHIVKGVRNLGYAGVPDVVGGRGASLIRRRDIWDSK